MIIGLGINLWICLCYVGVLFLCIYFLFGLLVLWPGLWSAGMTSDLVGSLYLGWGMDFQLPAWLLVQQGVLSSSECCGLHLLFWMLWLAPEHFKSSGVEAGTQQNSMVKEGGRMGLWEPNLWSEAVQLVGGSQSLTCSFDWCALHQNKGILLELWYRLVLNGLNKQGFVEWSAMIRLS